MYTELLDRLMQYLKESIPHTPRGKQHARLLDDMLFGGAVVSMVTYNHVHATLLAAKTRYIDGDVHNARALMYSSAYNMRLIR